MTNEAELRLEAEKLNQVLQEVVHLGVLSQLITQPHNALLGSRQRINLIRDSTNFYFSHKIL